MLLKHVLPHAITEIKIQTRGWLFRIMLAVALPLLVLYNVIVFFKFGRSLHGLSCTPAYANLVLVTILATVLLIFAGAEMGRRNRDAGRVDVLYVHDMTNAAFLLGQALGLFLIFGCLVLLATTGALVVNLLLRHETTLAWQPYVYYPLLIWLPGFVHILGLTSLLMRWIKNQAVVILLLLSYLLFALIYLTFRPALSLLDFTAFYQPLLFSDFTGLPELPAITQQRFFHLALGVAFLFASIIQFHRLPQSPVTSRALKIGAAAMLCLAITSGAFYQTGQNRPFAARERLISLTEHYAREKFVTIDKCAIEVSHQSNLLAATSTLYFTNCTGENVPRYVFTLNPGLRVSEIRRGGQPIAFERDEFILQVQPPEPLAPDQSDSLTITFAGGIETSICNLHVPANTLRQPFAVLMFKAAPKSAFLRRNYVLLNGDCLWYPSARLPHVPDKNPNKKRDFTRFELTVKTAPDLLAISQGKRAQAGDGRFVFTHETPLAELSLIIGKYEHHQVSTGRRTYHLYHHPKHDYYKRYFSLTNDDLVAAIKEIENECYGILPIDYPYSDFSLVETPIQFATFERYGVTGRRTPPQMSLLFEQNVAAVRSDFRSSLVGWQNSLDNGSQIDLFKSCLREILFEQGVVNHTFHEVQKTGFDFRITIFPQLFANSLCIGSADTLDVYSSIQAHLNFAIVPDFTAYIPFRNWFWLSEVERINLALSDNNQPYRPVERMSSDFQKLYGQFCCRYFLLEHRQEEVDNRLFDFINSHQHQFIDAKSFDQCLPGLFPDNYQIPRWQPGQDNTLPAFEFTDFQLYEIAQGRKPDYQVLFRAANVSDIPGIFEVYFLAEGEQLDWRRESAKKPEGVFYLPPNNCAEIGIVLPFMPTAITINPIIAQNLPIYTGQRLTPAPAPNRALFDGIRFVAAKNPASETTFIGDNSDEHFRPTSVSKPYLAGLFNQDDVQNSYYSSLRRPPSQWRFFRHANFYGRVQKTVAYIKAGVGNNFVSWNTDLRQGGNYTVYAYVPAKCLFERRGELLIQDFTYTVYHAEGQEVVTLNAVEAAEGWNELGRFYFSAGPAKVELSDKSTGALVVADAVRWEKN